MDVTPSRSRFVDLAARHGVVPVAVEVLADRLTPVEVYERLVGEGDGFLAESVEGGERWGRWSFVGWAPRFVLSADDGVVELDGVGDVPSGVDPLGALEAVVDGLTVAPAEAWCPVPEVPPLHTGVVGYLGYDVVRHLERLPNRPPDDRGLPDMVWMFMEGVAAHDRLRDSLLVVRNVFVDGDAGAAYAAAVAALRADLERLTAPSRAAVVPRPGFDAVPEATANLSREAFEEGVRRAIDHIAAGDAFQIVPSIRFEVDHPHDPFATYRALRLVNPSPFMFFLRRGDLAIAGSSPELMSRVREGRVYSRPIAGTRPRGRDRAEDARLEAELLADPKERAEHVMLVDLARNDLGRVCDYGTVSVDELMVVERYSHVMHLVSGVSGRLRDGLGPVDVLRATFPHGTVTGAPKVRAMEIIDELEPTSRGPYAGAVGYIDLDGNLDTAIALRTLVAKGGRAWVQAGAGVVYDSDPAREYEECRAKAAAVLAAVAAAKALA